MTDLFNPTFFMFLGILILVVALVVVYFESKSREQNHKIASMLSLVATLAEDMNGVKIGLHHLTNNMGGGNNLHPFSKQIHHTLEESNRQNFNNNGDNLINVSDDDEDKSDDDEDKSDDDEDKSDCCEDDSVCSEDDINCSENESDCSEDESNNQTNIKILRVDMNNEANVYDTTNNNDYEDIDGLYDLDGNMEKLTDLNSLSSNSSQSSTKNVIELLSHQPKNNEVHNMNILATEFKTININLEETFPDDSIDYKKFPLQKLRTLVSEKGIATDTSKMKKSELVKLLEDY
jgi:hypothetical protein